MGRGLTLYLLACVVLIGLAAAVFLMMYGGTTERHAVLVSALVALVVQVIAFVIARQLAAGGNGIAGWTLGAVICLVVLVVYGFVGRSLGLPSNAALLSLATFFFLTELIEPPLLNV
jgi:ABC-type Fe3+-siderophore transport system permease subunit